MLSLDEFHGCGAIRIIVPDFIHPRAHRIAPHEPGKLCYLAGRCTTSMDVIG
jgi:hypothetical protein